MATNSKHLPGDSAALLRERLGGPTQDELLDEALKETSPPTIRPAPIVLAE
jgi:hypothetical protein